MSYISAYYHCVFSTKGRRPVLTPEIRARLWPYMGGIARKHNIKAIEVGGVSDHVHMLISLPPTLPICTALQYIKGESSKWIHDTFPHSREFAWQKEYAAMSVSASSLDRVIRYIRNQEAHHRTFSFKDEFLVILQRHRISFDERYLWR